MSGRSPWTSGGRPFGWSTRPIEARPGHRVDSRRPIALRRRGSWAWPRACPGSSSVVTVAELMRRCAPAPEVADDGAAPIPVAALLRREGRSATGLPVVQTPAVGEILSTLPARQPLLRRGAIAAGALLAAGSVFGLTAAMNAPFTPPTSSGTSTPTRAIPRARAPPPCSTRARRRRRRGCRWRSRPCSPRPTRPPPRPPHRGPPSPSRRRPRRRTAAERRARPAPEASPATSDARSTPAKKKDGSNVVGDTVEHGRRHRERRSARTPRSRTSPTGVGNTVSGVGRQVGAITDPITDPITVPLTTAVKRVAAPLTTPVTSLLRPAGADEQHRAPRRPPAPPRAARSPAPARPPPARDGPAARPAAGRTPSATARSGWTAGSCAARWTRASPPSSRR